jgi:hypothetical protein
MPVTSTRDSEIGSLLPIRLVGGIDVNDRAVLSGITFRRTFLSATFPAFFIFTSSNDRFINSETESALAAFRKW